MRARLYFKRMPRAQELDERLKKVTWMYGMVLWAFRKFHEDWLRISDQYVSCVHLNALCARFGNTSAPKSSYAYLLMYLEAVKHFSSSYLNFKTSSLSMHATYT